MKKITVNGVKYLAVLVTKDAIVVKIGKDFTGKQCVICKISDESKVPYGVPIPDGNYEIVGLLGKLSDRQASEVFGMPLSNSGEPMFDHEEIQGEVQIAKLQYNLTDNTLLIKINPNG